MPDTSHLRLGVNIDHVATVRNARGGRHPDPVKAALAAVTAGADGITAHLREDRRHIRDADIARLKAQLSKPLNFEMAATREMVDIALKTRPHAVCIVPERRQELTTEGGLDVVRQHNHLVPIIAELKAAGIRVSLFIGADTRQIETAAEVGARSSRSTPDRGAKRSPTDTRRSPTPKCSASGKERHAPGGSGSKSMRGTGSICRPPKPSRRFRRSSSSISGIF
jgi:hypothetical protein